MRLTLYYLFFSLLYCCNFSTQKKISSDLTTPFERSKGFETATYHQTIAYYKNLANSFPEISIQSIGETDSGFPLHYVIYNTEKQFSFPFDKSKNTIFINNGIHAGESDGIDACMLLFRDYAHGTLTPPKNSIIITIPIYNVGGSLQRNSHTRTNQNGPKTYGFRGNARNYDLNRDFIKCDSKNAKRFTELFHKIDPDVFIDTHVSNGADYQYTLTHLFTQHNKLGGVLGNYLHTKLKPQLEHNLNKNEWPITPYVNVYSTVPDQGFSQFMDWPRYSTGYTTLFNTLGMMVETHMLKPYKNRVEGTYQLLKSMVSIVEKEGVTIKQLRKQSQKPTQTTYAINWAIDSSKHSVLQFKGFEGQHIPSKFTGGKRLKYDRSKPFEKPVTYYNYFKPTQKITIPTAYVIPQGWHNVIALLKLNNIALRPLKKDSTLTVESYKINTYETRNSPYEGHYLHYNTTVNSSVKEKTFRAGDYIVTTHQKGWRYLLETLEPEATDSFFNWNFFDTILQQKEGFSTYVWEDNAFKLLQNNPKLRDSFNALKAKNFDFSKNTYLQLDWLHKQSKHYEKVHLQYPVFRITN